MIYHVFILTENNQTFKSIEANFQLNQIICSPSLYIYVIRISVFHVDFFPPLILKFS
uniref:Uncharacterized protein n=1 Tax=Ciona intestinalis TaxID=7719 RepID=H2XZ29_CIOIN